MTTRNTAINPLSWGGNPFSRGVVATCSYEARQYGIHSAMPSSHAYRLCPQAVFVKPRFEVYRAASQQIRKIFTEYTDLVEPLSLDEAYLDVTAAEIFKGSATLIALATKATIKRQVGLIASAGISYNKFLDKLASDVDKPDGLYVITPTQGPELAEKLPVNKFHGIGKVTAAKMQTLGIHTGKDLRGLSLAALQQHFGGALLRHLPKHRPPDHQIRGHGNHLSAGHPFKGRNPRALARPVGTRVAKSRRQTIVGLYVDSENQVPQLCADHPQPHLAVYRDPSLRTVGRTDQKYRCGRKQRQAVGRYPVISVARID